MDYIKAISDTEQKYNLKPGVLKKLIEVESSGNLNARSSSGAIGLTQLMPDTAKEMGVDPHDPMQNIEGGARYLRKGLDKFNGNYAQAIAGYNAGHSNKAVEAMDFNSLPDETKHYANKFLDFIVSPASADETPYHASANGIKWNDDAQPKGANQPEYKISWHDDSNKIEQEPNNAPMSWGEVGKSAIQNIPKSGGEYVGSLINAVKHPVDTAQSLVDLANGGLQKVLPDSANKLMYAINPDLAKNKDKATQAGEFYKQRYGGIDNLKSSIANDPVGVAGDLSALLTGGGSAVSKIPTLANSGAKLSRIGSAIEPLNSAARLLPKIGGQLANVVGGVGTHTGGESLKTAAKAGLSGGQDALDFTDNLRGNVPLDGVLQKAKANLQEMNAKKGAEYRSGMVDISNDSSVLDFNNIDNVLSDASKKIAYKGEVKNEKAASALQQIADKIDHWKTLNPAEFHTPEGLDALKQQVGSIVEELPFEQKQARMVGDNVYNAIKNEISRQAPTYSKVMKDYSQASDLVHEIERTLSLKGTASVDTAMRKLQSLMRNNVNTNYGNRLNLARQLEDGGHNNILPSLAGQTLSSLTSRGLGNLQMGSTAFGGLAAGGAASLPLLLPSLAMQSPRLMGEAAYGLGKMARIGKASGKVAKPNLLNYLYESGQDRSKKDKK